jgi:steroid 5-alpha reductase family enzyme
MFWSHLGYALGLNMIPMTALWMLSVILSDVSIVDIAWSMLFVLTSSYYLFASGLFSFGHIRVTLVYVLLLIWAVRLAVYLRKYSDTASRAALLPSHRRLTRVTQWYASWATKAKISATRNSAPIGEHAIGG